jgi:hypothetical protein
VCRDEDSRGLDACLAGEREVLVTDATRQGLGDYWLATWGVFVLLCKGLCKYRHH